jgi:ribosomal protein S18 acetylase RimI-like enzyme
MKVELLRLNENDPKAIEWVQTCLEDAPAYWLRITGTGPEPEGARSTFAVLPPGKDYSAKYVMGVFLDGELVGIVDLIRGFPNQNTAMLGLLLIREKFQRNGIGRQAYFQIEAFVQRQWPEVNCVRIGVIATNEPAFPFWRHLGFKETGERSPYQENEVVSENVVLMKSLRTLVNC